MSKERTIYGIFAPAAAQQPGQNPLLTEGKNTKPVGVI